MKEKAHSRNFIDLTGQRFGRLVVVGYHHRDASSSYWLCKCDCGNTTIVRRAALIEGRSKSCGCLRSASTAERNKARKGVWHW